MRRNRVIECRLLGRSGQSLPRMVAVNCPNSDEPVPIERCHRCPDYAGWCLSTAAGEPRLVCHPIVKPPRK